MIQLELTLQQAQQLAQLVEIAMKATNVPNMRVGLPLYDNVPNMRVGLPLYDLIEATVIKSQQTPKPE